MILTATSDLLLPLAIVAGALIVAATVTAVLIVRSIRRRREARRVRELTPTQRLLRTAAGAAAELIESGINRALQGSIDVLASRVEDERPDLAPATAADGTVTIFFSDIENSTAINEKLGDDGWFELLGAHNRVVRKQLKAHDGYEVKSQGDGFMCAFADARAGVVCAVSIQRELSKRRDRKRMGLPEAIHVRMGLHSGDAIHEKGDFFGVNVAKAARIAGQAGGGEILVSGVVRDLAGDDGGLEFEDERRLELKGFAEPERVYRVRW